MKEIQYLEIFKKALLLTWKNKFLWIFGFFVLLGSFSLSLDSSYKTQTSNQTENIKNQIFINPKLAIVVILIAILLFLAFLFLKVVGISGIIKATSNIIVYKQCSISSIFFEVKRFGIKLIIFDLVLILIAAILISIMSAPFIYLLLINDFIFASLAFLLAFFIIFPLFILAYFIRRYAYMYIVLGEMKIKNAMEAAYSLFEKNFKESLIMGLYIIGTNILLMILIIFLWVALLIAAAPFLLIAYFVFTKASAIILGVFLCILAILVTIALISGFEVFVHAAWTMFFQEISLDKLNKKAEEEKKESMEGIIPNPEAV